ncbi:MAG: hypothetical protein HQ522_06930 [Bacteroidetes bacterium]|nr:hypothetical protein [Bacteroidota bacterium]
MAQKGKIQLIIIITASPEQTEEGNRIFRLHEGWMADSHPREGDKALLTYDVSIAPELSNPLDPTSEPTGNTNFILAEVYESGAGVENHFKLAEETWNEFPAFMKWIGECKSTVIPAAVIEHSLW